MHSLKCHHFYLLNYRHVSFFFQAEDGIRDYKMTGVQTCALPILPVLLPRVVDRVHHERIHVRDGEVVLRQRVAQRPLLLGEQVRRPGVRHVGHDLDAAVRSEERRVGKEWRSAWWPEYETERMCAQ